MFLFSILIILYMHNSSSRIVDWQISDNWSILLTRQATSFIGEIVAFVSQYPKSPKGNIT